ncbi:MAG: YgiQ family radical SAM protein [Bacillota bacterium]
MNKKVFLPISKNDVKKRGWKQLDFIIVSGDAYVDHPSFGPAVIGRILENAGYRVGIIPQPDWRGINDFKRLGKPRLAFLVTAGNMDSMVSNYTVNKNIRREDAYSPGGKTGRRPDRATIVYCNRLKEVYKNIPLIIGGVEASLRRFAHYDYWDDKVRRSIMFDCRADLLIYGMAENQILSTAEALDAGMDIKYIRHIPGTCYIISDLDDLYGYKILPSYREVKNDKEKYAESFKIQEQEQDPIRGNFLVQKHGNRYLVQNPPADPLNQERLDYIFELPYQRDYHPYYENKGGVPAIKEVKFSITSSRGCFGGCSFCALNFHQGRIVRSRSKKSIVKEAKLIASHKDFKGYIHDVGGPTANFRKAACIKQKTKGACKQRQCLTPHVCKDINIDNHEYIDILRTVRNLPGIKKVFIRSGIRFDYLMADNNYEKYLREICKHHVSGQLKVAPEHVSTDVLNLMRKPSIKTFDKFRKDFYRINNEIGKEQYLIPYFISSHPGSKLEDAIELAEYLRDIDHHPQQVQDFYPTPGTRSTTMYYTGLDLKNMEEIYVARSIKEKRMQRALLQYHYPHNYNLVYKALIKADRQDLIGYHSRALIKPG